MFDELYTVEDNCDDVNKSTRIYVRRYLCLRDVSSFCGHYCMFCIIKCKGIDMYDFLNYFTRYTELTSKTKCVCNLNVIFHINHESMHVVQNIAVWTLRHPDTPDALRASEGGVRAGLSTLARSVQCDIL